MPSFKVPAKFREACVRFERLVQFRWNLYRYSLWVAPAAALIVLLAAKFGQPAPWLIDLASHFILPSMAVALVAGLLLKQVRKMLLGACAVGAVLCLWAHAQTASTMDVPASLVVANANVLYLNKDTAKLDAFLATESVEVLGVVEVSDKWKEALEQMKDRYPHQHIISRIDAFGIALLSKWPLEDVMVLGEDLHLPPSITATVVKNGQRLRVAVTHPLPPGSPSQYADQQQQVELVANWVAADKTRTWVMGDMNATPWSSVFQRLQRAGLRSANPLSATWPARWGGGLKVTPLPFLPIDHIMVGPGLLVSNAHRGADIGSDHLPVVATLGWVPPPCSQCER